MVDLVTNATALTWLRLSETSSQSELVSGLRKQAQDIVLGYIGKGDDEWTTETVPARITAAIMLVLARLHAADDGLILTDAVKSLLRRDRKPVTA